MKIPGFEILGRLGTGAFGTVYRAREADGRVVALKVMSPELIGNPTALGRFKREIRAVLQLDHVNLVKGYSAGEHNGTWYCAMELLEGRTAARETDRKGGLHERVAIKIGLAVAYALQHAAQFDLIHRDIKPDNIILTVDGVVKLCDLGLARTTNTDNPLTLTGQVVGTPHFMSPEQAAGDELDHRTDIFSLGATLYYLLTARTPIEGPSAMLALELARSGQPTIPLRQLKPDLNPATYALIEKMSAPKVEERHATLAELVDDLKAALEAIGEAASSADITRRPGAQATTGTIMRRRKRYRACRPPSAYDVAIARMLIDSKQVPRNTMIAQLDALEQAQLLGADISLLDVLAQADVIDGAQLAWCASTIARSAGDQARELFFRTGVAHRLIEPAQMALVKRQQGRGAPPAELLIADPGFSPESHGKLLALVQAMQGEEEDRRVANVAEGWVAKETLERCRQQQADMMRDGSYMPLVTLLQMAEGGLDRLRSDALLRAVRRGAITGQAVDALIDSVTI